MTSTIPSEPGSFFPPERQQAIALLGQDVIALPRDTVLEMLVARIKKKTPTRVAFFNSNLANALARGGNVREFLADFIVLNDGLATDIAAFLATGRRFPSNLNGTDLIPEFLERVPSGTRVFLYGGQQPVVQRVAQRLTARGHVTVCGLRDGYFDDPHAVAADAQASNPDIILVALGNPRQEQWIREYPLGDTGPTLVGVGALFDFLAERVPRAPVLMRSLRIEWLFRLWIEPKRLLRRYTLDIVEFLWRVLSFRNATQ